jgi:hypothetical protein
MLAAMRGKPRACLTNFGEREIPKKDQVNPIIVGNFLGWFLPGITHLAVLTCLKMFCQFPSSDSDSEYVFLQSSQCPLHHHGLLTWVAMIDVVEMVDVAVSFLSESDVV